MRYSEVTPGMRVQVTTQTPTAAVPVGTQGTVLSADRYGETAIVDFDNGYGRRQRALRNLGPVTAATPSTFVSGGTYRVTMDRPDSAPVRVGDVVRLTSPDSGVVGGWLFEIVSTGDGRPVRRTGCYVPQRALEPINAPVTGGTLTHAEVRSLMEDGRRAGMCEVRFDLLTRLGIPREPVEPTVAVADVIREARALADANGWRTQVDGIIRAKGWEPATPFADGDIIRVRDGGEVDYRVYVIGDEKFYRSMRAGTPRGGLTLINDESEWVKVS